MALYEHIFLARQDVTQQQVEALTEQIKTTIASRGGAVTKVEPWGLKSLAFRIKKNRKAHFTMLNIAGPSEAVVETERLLASTRTSSAISPSASTSMRRGRRRCCVSARRATVTTADRADRAGIGRGGSWRPWRSPSPPAA